jgi:phage-related protein
MRACSGSQLSSEPNRLGRMQLGWQRHESAKRMSGEQFRCASRTLYDTCTLYGPAATTGGPRKIPVVFYRTPAGVEVVRNWLRDLDEADRNAIGQDLMRVQYRWPVGMPLCRSLGEGLWEVRSTLPSSRIARVLFSVQQGRIVALHGFIKKTQKASAEDLALARRRNKEFEA